MFQRLRLTPCLVLPVGFLIQTGPMEPAATCRLQNGLLRSLFHHFGRGGGCQLVCLNAKRFGASLVATWAALGFGEKPKPQTAFPAGVEGLLCCCFPGGRKQLAADVDAGPAEMGAALMRWYLLAGQTKQTREEPFCEPQDAEPRWSLLPPRSLGRFPCK